MKTKKIVLSNDFHNTEVVVYAKVLGNGDCWISEGQVKRARKALCGIHECTCGDYAGCRPIMVEEDYTEGGIIKSK